MFRTMLSPGFRLATTPSWVSVPGGDTLMILLNCVVGLAPVFVTVTENVPVTFAPPFSASGSPTSVRFVTTRSGRPGFGVLVGGCGVVVSVLVGWKVGV